MSTMKITTPVKKYLDAHKKQNIDKTINELLDFVEPVIDNYCVPVERVYHVKVSKDTMKRIKSYRTLETESYDKILRRVIAIAIENEYV